MTEAQPSDQERQGDRLLDVVVVGGSQAGLAMAWHLARQGLRFVVLEAAPGGRPRLAVPVGLAEVVHPGPVRRASRDGVPGSGRHLPTKDPVADYLQAYVAAFDLPVRLHAEVTELRRLENGTFEVRTAADEVFGARQVVVATGPFQVPFVPPAAEGLDPSVTQVHSADYRNPQTLPAGPMLVVGGGNSGFQIAEELAATRQVDLSIATGYPMLPQRLAGRDLCWWLTRLGLLRVTVTSRPGQRMSRRDVVIGTNRRRLQKAGVRFRPRLVDAKGHTVRFADHRLLEDVGVVVWATGYRPDHAWIQIPGVVREGQVAHRRGVTDMPGLYFLGLSWQHTRGSALLGFVNDDATYLADRIAAHQQTAEPAEVGDIQQRST